MNTANPKEYITLPSGGSSNFALYTQKGHRNQQHWTWFEKVFQHTFPIMTKQLKNEDKGSVNIMLVRIILTS